MNEPGINEYGSIPITRLLGQTFLVLKRRALLLMLLFFVVAVAFVASVAVIIGAGVFISELVPSFRTVVMLASVVLSLIAGFCALTYCLTAFYEAVADEECGFKAAFVRAKRHFVPFLWVATLLVLVLQGGYLHLIVPGIILTVWFFFSFFVCIEEGETGVNTLLKSRHYVEGLWAPTALKIFVALLISFAIGLIPIVGQFLATPFTSVYAHLLYRDLKKAKEGKPFEPTKNARHAITLIGALGLIMAVLLMSAILYSIGETVMELERPFELPPAEWSERLDT